MIHAYISNLELANLKDGKHARITAEPAAEGVVCYSIIIADQHAVVNGVVPPAADAEMDSEPEPSRAHAHLHDHLIAAMVASAAGMARRDRLSGQPLSIERFAENVIRATLHALNSNVGATQC